jgi:2',3'-cyclic-nucleotide 2'-phosphodiesterase (5'-nucleotidase family)
LARRATAIEQERNDAEGAVLVLDAGSALDGQWIARESEGKVMVEAMNAMGYDALTIGRMDISLGLETLKARAAEAEFAVLSANLVNAEDQTPLFEPYVILERAGSRLAVIGLSEPEIFESPAAPKSTVLRDPVETAADYVGRLRGEVDLVIVLSHLGIEPDIALAEAVPGIDIIVGGNTRKLMTAPERVGNTLIIQQGYRGEWIGLMRASFDAQGTPADYEAEALTLDDKYADDPEIVELLSAYRQAYPSPTPRPTLTPDPRTPTANMTQTVEALRTRAFQIMTATAAAAPQK